MDQTVQPAHVSVPLGQRDAGFPSDVLEILFNHSSRLSLVNSWSRKTECGTMAPSMQGGKNRPARNATPLLPSRRVLGKRPKRLIIVHRKGHGPQSLISKWRIPSGINVANYSDIGRCLASERKRILARLP
jgi:hypothetical protein